MPLNVTYVRFLKDCIARLVQKHVQHSNAFLIIKSIIISFYDAVRLITGPFQIDSKVLELRNITEMTVEAKINSGYWGKRCKIRAFRPATMSAVVPEVGIEQITSRC